MILLIGIGLDIPTKSPHLPSPHLPACIATQTIPKIANSPRLQIPFIMRTIMWYAKYRCAPNHPTDINYRNQLLGTINKFLHSWKILCKGIWILSTIGALKETTRAYWCKKFRILKADWNVNWTAVVMEMKQHRFQCWTWIYWSKFFFAKFFFANFWTSNDSVLMNV